MAEKEKMEIAIISEEEIKSKIFIIRGQKAMLDEDLAMIYGYTTKAFNQQVKNNIAKFDEDFRFQLTNEEVEELSRSRILTSMQEKGTKGGRTYNPYIFTEQGIYMLMTVLRGDLAVRQSKDGGRRTTLLSRLEDIQLYDDMIKQLLGNPVLKLK
ncbi:MAG: ORF6N domain-containing protein [Lachnospiraceae bacterium]|nr:ORF6N domain-containing protein [Lachnospiraceae bacterium]